MPANLAQLARRLARVERIARPRAPAHYRGLTVDVPTVRRVMQVLYEAGELNNVLASRGYPPLTLERIPNGHN